VDILIVNESEGSALSGEQDVENISKTLYHRYPLSAIVVTMGEGGATLRRAKVSIHQPAQRVQAVDTTAAGDTFIGFFLAKLIQTNDSSAALAYACRAAAICVTRAGAAPSIPRNDEMAVGAAPPGS
jgi:ribokinase